MSFNALVAWTLVLGVLITLALPLAAALFPRHPHRGASFAPVIAIAVLSLTGYLVGHVSFGFPAALAGVLVLVLSSTIAWRRGYRVERQHIGVIRTPVVVFVLAFVGLLIVRFLDPGAVPAGGEKFLDIALVATLDRTAVLPPEDMWFAGTSIRYYYGGQLAVALLGKLAGVPPRFAYNLGLATFYAMLASGVYGLATSISAQSGDRNPRLAGFLAVFLVAIGGRLVTPIRLLAGQLPVDFATTHLEWVVAGIRKQPTESFQIVGDLHEWSFWLSRYVVPDALHVYPAWSFLNGDLHAHLLATPFLVLAAATALAAARADGRRRLLLLFGVLPAVAGLLGLTSTWSLPTAIGLGGLSLVLADRHPLADTWFTQTRRMRVCSRYLVAGATSAVVGLAAVTWVHPFFLYQQPQSRGIGFLPPGGTLGPLLLAHGLFLAIFAWGFRSQWSDWHRLTRRGWILLGIILTIVAGFVLHLGLDGLLVFGAVIVLGWYVRRRGASDAAVLAVAGAGILLVAELAYAKVWPYDPNAPRWNTIYKISMQAFVLWGTAAAVVLSRQVTALRARMTGWMVPRDAIGSTLLVALLLCSAATFPAMALAEHVGGTAGSSENALSATRYVENDHSDEAPAIEWLRDNVSGTPTIVTAPGEQTYTWSSAPSSLTGIPTVVGWRHVAGYHGRSAYETRVQLVRVIYEGNWPSAALLLDFYDVEYVYLGPVERERYEIRRFAARPGVSIAYRNHAVTIYEIDADAACAATNRTCPPD